jgi:RNA 2',3'-cyclic 3'-phosphodiesterase
MARMRTFIAVDLEEKQKDRCVALQENVARTGAQVKWVSRDNLHVTLLFLGEVDERQVPDVCRAVSSCCARIAPFSLSAEAVSGFPNPRRPRTIYVGVGEGAAELIALHDALEPPLLELGCYRREARPFTPHITLGRIKSEGGNDLVAAALLKYANWQGGVSEAGEVLVMSSELTPKEPIYMVLSRGALRGTTEYQPGKNVSLP